MRPVLVIIGPSGSGKSRVVRELHRRDLVTVHPTWTTRPRRADEGDDAIEHRFVSAAVFDDLCASRFFADSVTPFGLPYRYGLPHVRPHTGGPIDVVMLRAPFVARFARFVPNYRIYQLETDLERTLARLVERGCEPSERTARLADHDGEIAHGRQIAHRVFVNDGSLSSLVGQVADALRVDMVRAA